MVILIIILLSLIVFILLSLLVIFLLFLFDTFLELPYVATTRQKVPTIIKLASIKKGDTVIDLGSGDGRLLFESAKRGAFAIGYELNPLLVLFTRMKAFFLGAKEDTKSYKRVAPLKDRHSSPFGKVIVYKKNLWEADLQVADVIFVYGRKKTMPRFEKFVYQNAKKGTRIIVNTDKTVTFPTKKPIKSENGIYLYKV